MSSKTYDALVIGSGPGGYVCGIRLAQLGLRTAVVEQDRLGGVCLNVGCVPSKALITASKLYQRVQHAGAMGIHADGARIDWDATQAWKRGITDKLSGGIGALLKANKVDHVKGSARLLAPAKVGVTGADGSTREIEAAHIVVATGSSPVQIPGFPFGGRIVDSTAALALAEIPKRLAVVGGGYIGLEMGGVYARLGAQVTIVEALDRLCATVDADLVRPVEQSMKKLGVVVHTSTKALGCEETASGVTVRLEKSKKGALEPLSVEADVVLVTVGRRPNTRGLGLEEVGVAMTERGFIAVDAHLRTNVPGIYGIGDVVGNPMLAHKASKEGEICAEVIAGKPSRFDARVVPAVVFTDPEIATAGPTLEELEASGRKLKTGKFLFGALGRAMTTNETAGFARVVSDAQTDELLAVHIVGPEASELIAEAALAIEMGAATEDLALTIHSHPTLAEATMEAAKVALGEAVHAVNR